MLSNPTTNATSASTSRSGTMAEIRRAVGSEDIPKSVSGARVSKGYSLRTTQRTTTFFFYFLLDSARQCQTVFRNIILLFAYLIISFWHVLYLGKRSCNIVLPLPSMYNVYIFADRQVSLLMLLILTTNTRNTSHLTPHTSPHVGI